MFNFLFSDTFLILLRYLSVTLPYRKVSQKYQKRTLKPQPVASEKGRNQASLAYFEKQTGSCKNALLKIVRDCSIAFFYGY